MGLLDFMDKEKRRHSAIEKNTRRLGQIYGQAESRQKAIQQLREDGSEEAIYGLLTRYNVRVEPTITDDEERQWVLDIVVEFGTRAVPSIRRFVLTQDAVTWPLRALQEIRGREDAIQLVVEVLRKMSGEYQRAHAKKITLIKHLAQLEARSPEAIDALVPFLEDMDDDTVIATLETLAELDEEGRSREAVLALLDGKARESARMRGLVFKVLADRGWTVKGCRPTVEELIAEPYYLTGEGMVKRRTE